MGCILSCQLSDSREINAFSYGNNDQLSRVNEYTAVKRAHARTG